MLIMLFFVTSFFAQDQINFEFDYSRYNYDSSTVYLEVYYSVGQNNLTQRTVNDSVFVESIIHIQIKNLNTEEFFVDKKYRIDSFIDEADSMGARNFVGVIGYRIPTGFYSLNVTASDLNDTTNTVMFSEPLELSSFTDMRYLISDIELASRIISQSRNTESIFYKNTLEVIPNPAGIYGQNYPMLFYYSEIYNILSDTTEGGMIINKQIQNSYGTKVYEQSKNLNKSNNSIVEVGAVNVSKFPTGAYTFYINLLNTESGLGVSSSKKFFVYNPGVKDTTSIASSASMDVMSSEFGVMSEDECDYMFSAVKYILSGDQINRYESLDSLNTKRQFMFNFWRRQDPSPGTPENEFKEEFERRIELVDTRYRTFTKRGIKTDRGRVYLVYGEPDEVELHPNDYDKKPYEIWYYNSIEGGVSFVFGDIVGYGDYELLHSTKRGEMRDDNWVRRIRTN